MHDHHRGAGRRHAARTPAGWPGLHAATRRAATYRQPAAESGIDPRRAMPVATAAPATGAVEGQVRVLDRMVSLLTVLVESQERGALDPDALGLASLMTADLDRHLTDLMDAQYEPADDVRVIAIEQALANMRTRLGEFVEQR